MPGSAFAIPMAAPRLLSPVQPPCLPSLISARFLDSALSSSAKVRCSSSCDSIDRLFCTVPHRTHTRSPWRMSMSKTALWPGGVHSGILHTTSELGAHADLDIMYGVATSFVSSPALVLRTDECSFVVLLRMLSSRLPPPIGRLGAGRRGAELML